MEITKTNRGFVLCRFTDHYGVRCSIQESSLATENAIWLGADDLGLKRLPDIGGGWKNVDLDELFPEHSFSANTRMHLTQRQVQSLLPMLVHFAQTGKLPEDHP